MVKAFYEAYIQPVLSSEIHTMSYNTCSFYRLDNTDEFRDYIHALLLQIGIHVRVRASVWAGT